MNNTPQLIEAFDKFEEDREYHLHNVDRKDYLDFIETQIAQAEKRGEERMKKKCLEVIEETIDDIEGKRKITPVQFLKTTNWLEGGQDSLKTIRNSISSL